MLSPAELEVLDSFREYQIKPDEMLCFHGQRLLQYQKPLHLLMEKKLVRQERLDGAYCLTRAGFEVVEAETRARSKS
jgi:hypothetical protein